jgi:ADP-heptose:LPS heptosyltransferase
MSHPGIVWRVVSPARPILWPRGADETWLMNPPLRYVITSDQQDMVQTQIQSWSDLKGSRYYRPLLGNVNLTNTRIVVERHRDRGLGDLLFTTGPLAYLQHVSSHSAQIFYYASTDRSHVLHGNPALFNEMPLCGPVIYDTLQLYHYHWFIESATEYDEEPEQMNVYDSLYKQIGLEPEKIPVEFKRPVLKAYKADKLRAEDLFRLLYFERQEDWRKIPYWVVAPISTSNLRSAPYNMWLKLIGELAKTRHVIVVGQIVSGLNPQTDIPCSQFQESISQMAASNKNVVNLLGRTPMRLTIGLLCCAEGLITLDSGLLYVAEGLRTPAISIWGPQHPATRIGYDPEYMELAIWEYKTCDWAPCFSYRKFPDHKCPRGDKQHICEPLRAVTPEAIMAKVEKVWSRKPGIVAPVAAGTPKK